MNAEKLPAIAGQVEPSVRPAAWIDASSLRWLKGKPETRSTRTEVFGTQQEGQAPLYDQAGLDAAIASMRERWAEAVMAELDGNGQAHAIVAYATRA